ncbi:MAG: hypothetical protein ACLRIP_16785 [Blautia massiliensis (ex Durand et al. 2017)]
MASVTRGICKMDEYNNLTVVETSNIVKTADGAVADGTADTDSLAMNMWDWHRSSWRRWKVVFSFEKFLIF